ncbi:GT2 family glycosyltransferase [Mycobacterium sp. OAS707]|uniref:glycosyltransferase family 2 protein n=1 Tax=Mycobacterium sp. OAS707 TaxID=2663822 RepID=UPI001789A35A|nr:glycosyltransferase [Mycobacterium sp. OAS707]MBE1547954.1 GT2 family glycosyltransferase [Mycobacterium sp. OAS707]
MTETLRPIVSAAPAQTWAGATWVGQIDEEHVDGQRMQLFGAEDFARARLLVWSNGQPRGFVEASIVDGGVDGSVLRAGIDELPAIVEKSERKDLPPISVVVCTRDRPEQLRDVIKNLTELPYPEYEVLVVDNNPASGLTPPVVEAFAGANVRLVSAAGSGLSIARNTALKHAHFDIVAFTDDDVIVDPNWLDNLAFGFGRDERVACVCGMVPSAELATPAQSYFDRRVGWARRCDAAVFSLADPPPDDALFPFRVAQYGTGANFAVRTDAAVEVGGFDEGMGIGSPTGGGEDIDMFVRLLLAGWLLVREPSAVVWHQHRRTPEELEDQIHNYGLGLGAWISKLLVKPRTLRMVLVRGRKAIDHLRGVTVVDPPDTIADDPRLVRLDRRELHGVLTGPFALARARIAGRKAKPLTTPSFSLFRALDYRQGQMFGDPDNAIAAGRLAVLAVVLGLVGALGAVSALPTFLLAIAVGLFMFGGPGSLVMSWYTRLPTGVMVSLVPAISVSICLLVVTALIMLGFYDPTVVLFGLTGATVAFGLLRLGFLAARARRKAVTSA